MAPRPNNPLPEWQAVKNWRSAMDKAGFPGSRIIGVFHFSQLLAPGGDRKAAEVAYRRLLDILPDHKAALEGLLFLLQIQGRADEALEYRRRLLALHVQDLGVEAGGQGEAVDYLLAGEGWMSPPDKAPRAYIQGLFDQYSTDFDAHLVGRLNYQTPELILDVASEVLGESSAGLDVLDLGCGTGLAGERFRSFARHIHGIDLSHEMLEQARARGVYDRLEQGDLVEIAGRCRAAYDLVVAVDVLIYFGALAPVISAVRGCLRDGCFFIFSVEKGIGKGFRLRSTGRYQHDADYVEDCAREGGFEVSRRREIILRYQEQLPVWGYVFALCSR